MMRPWIAIGLMTLLGAAVVMLIAWLSARSSRALRVVGMLLSGVVSLYCVIYVGALIAEFDDPFTPKSRMLVLILVFAATGAGAAAAAFTGLRAKPRPA